MVQSGETLPLQIWVSADRASLAAPVDLSAYFNDRGVAFEGENIPGFDGQGGSLPGEMLPPDGASELDGNPLLIGKPGLALYPSGYYSTQTGSGWSSNHRISFLFPSKVDKDVVVAKGQTISLPSIGCHTIHILAAAASDAPVPFKINGIAISVYPWTFNVGTALSKGETIALKYPYRIVKSQIDGASPCVLMDYALPANDPKSLMLPDDPRVKILAITLEK
jgi:hypothetical protein